MKITLKYFARIAELTGKKEEDFVFENVLSLPDLLNFLISQYGSNLQDYLFEENSQKVKSIFKFLINGKTFKFENIVIEDNSEVVIIPPVSGG